MFTTMPGRVSRLYQLTVTPILNLYTHSFKHTNDLGIELGVV